MYCPELHKNKNKGKGRAIPILGDAREALTDYLNRDPKSCCFSPTESVAWWQASKRSVRKSKVQPSQQCRAMENPKVHPGYRYTQDSYRRAIARACKRAKVEPWHAYQLRHLKLTEIRDVLGVEHAQAMGGHSRIPALTLRRSMQNNQNGEPLKPPDTHPRFDANDMTKK